MLDAAQQRITAAFPDGAELASEVLRGLTPPAWTLEWHLPWWLGHAFALDKDLIRELVISNALGLLSVRLEDDASDGDLDTANVRVAGGLARAAYDEAIAVYHAHLAEDVQFWAFLDRSMAEWRAGSNGPNPSSRGAPLKIAAYACCLLGDRYDAWAALDRCLDHVLAAFVRYDQFCDWESDLAAGRWNAFVASVTQAEQRPPDAARIRSAVLAALLTTSVVDRWFLMIDADASLALVAARELGLTPLSDHLEDWAARTKAQGADFDAHYRRAADLATEIMFGAAHRTVLQPAPAVSTR